MHLKKSLAPNYTDLNFYCFAGARQNVGCTRASQTFFAFLGGGVSRIIVGDVLVLVFVLNFTIDIIKF